MTERDAFEVRFEAAVRGYVGRVSSDLDPAELAHRIAVAEPRRHGLAAVLTGRLVANPLRMVWVLLLVAALVALVAGTLAVGSRLLESREPLPEQRPALLEGMVTEEIEPGVFRVVNDGVRDLSSTDAVDVVAGYDGGIWLLREQGFLRLGSDGVHEWPWSPVPPRGVPESHVLQVAPDGTLWVIPTGSVFSTGRWFWPGEVFRSTDGEAWSSQPCPGGYCKGVTVAPDGTLWASWSWDDGWACERGVAEEDCEWWVGYLSPTGWQQLDGSTPADFGFERLVFTDAGDLYGVASGWDSVLYRYEDGTWRQISYVPLVDVGPDGTRWQFGGFSDELRWDELTQSLRDDETWGLARFADGEWEGWTSADLPEIRDDLGLDYQFKVAPDGSVWFSLWRNGPRTDNGMCEPAWGGPDAVDPDAIDCDGLARFDGETLDRFLPGQSISMDVAADGSVWVLAGNEQGRDLYLITPEAVAASE
jgi:hypothetical protein